MQNNLIQLSGVDLVVPTHGLEGAKSYPMGPNCRVPLFDDAEDILYIKQTDANGFPTIREFELKERVVIDKDSTGNGVVLDDIRNMIREEISAAVKEMNSNGQQSVPAANSESTDRDESGIANVTKHNGKPGTKPNGYAGSTRPKGQNPSIVEHSKEQQ